MIFQISFTIAVLALVGHRIGVIGASPFPLISNWGDKLAGICGLIFVVSAPTALIAWAWGA